MPIVVLPLLLVAAAAHAGWNALLKGSENPMSLAARAVSLGTLVSLPPVGAAWLLAGRPGLPVAGWLLAALSAGLELLYFIFLSRAYRLGELSLVYPIARGTAPLLAVLVGLVLLGERLGGLGLVGILCLLAGIWAVRRPAAGGAAVGPALATGVMIAAYTSVDRVGVRLGPPWLYGWLLWLFAAILLVVFTVVRRMPVWPTRVEMPTSLAVAVLMTSAYFLVLFALSVAPLAIVAPLRESAIVLVTGWGIWRLGERRGATLRIAGAVAIVLGIALLALG